MTFVEASLAAVQRFFQVRNQLWLEGSTKPLEAFLESTDRETTDAVLASIWCKRREAQRIRLPLLRSHAEIEATPETDEVHGSDGTSQNDAFRTWLIRERIYWVHQDGLHYRVESRLVSHRQQWIEADGWRLAKGWESNEQEIPPKRMADALLRNDAKTEIFHVSEAGVRKLFSGGFAGRSATATVPLSYDRFRAFRYAELWWDHFHPAFPRLREDCTNFVSQCLLAGGMTMDHRSSRAEGWWIDEGATAESERWSYSWATTEGLRRYLQKHRGAQVVRRPEKLLIGDIIFYDWYGTGQFHHAAIVTDFDEAGNPLVSAHTDPSYHRDFRYFDSPAWTPRTRYEFVHIPDRA